MNFCENGTQTIPQLTSAPIRFSANLPEIYLDSGIFVRKVESTALAKRLACRLNVGKIYMRDGTDFSL